MKIIIIIMIIIITIIIIINRICPVLRQSVIFFSLCWIKVLLRYDSFKQIQGVFISSSFTVLW